MAAVLVISMVILGFVFLASDTFIKLTFFNQSLRVQRFSSAAAESAAATAVSQILSEPTFGQDVTKDKIELGDGDLGRHQTAYVQFDPDSGKPYSVNNMTSDAVVPGYGGTPVPAYGAQIIAVGSYGGREALYEIILVRPGITHAAASSGQLILDGHNEAASIKTTEQLAQMTQGGLVDSDSVEDKLRNTTVASGGKTGEPLVLKGDLTLYGDAISGAGIRREGDIKFLHGGVAKANSDVEIPTIDDIEAYDPQGLDGTTALNPTYADSNNLFQGRNRAQGDLVINGDLELDGALIYVTGNLTVTGNIKGDGALIALGDVKLTGQSTIEADSKVAVISKGDLTLTGTGSERSLFSGLVYSEGKVEASRITVVGGIVANNPSDPESASMEVSETKLVNFAEKTKFDVVSEFVFPPIPAGGALDNRFSQLGVEIVYPNDVSEIVKPDGTWNGQVPSFGYVKGAVTYNSLSDIPGISGTDLAWIMKGLVDYTEGDVAPKLPEYFGKSLETSVFQLDPNQLLTVTGGYRAVLRRPLKR